MSIGSDLLTRPDLDFIDGEFYAGNSRQAYGWMRAHEPVFRDRNGLAGLPRIAPYCRPAAIPNFSPTQAARGPITSRSCRAMIDMDDPLHLQRRKLVNTGFAPAGP